MHKCKVCCTKIVQKLKDNRREYCSGACRKRQEYMLKGAQLRERHKTWVARTGYRNKRRQEIRDFVNNIKRGPCKDCGNCFDPVCMDFDHRPNEKKVANVSVLVAASCRSKESILVEIAKCDLVCANCHRLRTKVRRNE